MKAQKSHLHTPVCDSRVSPNANSFLWNLSLNSSISSTWCSRHEHESYTPLVTFSVWGLLLFLPRHILPFDKVHSPIQYMRAHFFLIFKYFPFTKLSLILKFQVLVSLFTSPYYLLATSLGTFTLSNFVLQSPSCFPTIKHLKQNNKTLLNIYYALEGEGCLFPKYVA